MVDVVVFYFFLPAKQLYVIIMLYLRYMPIGTNGHAKCIFLSSPDNFGQKKRFLWARYSE